MKILGINRVELAVHDPNKEAEVMAELFGMRFRTSETAEHGVLSRTDFGSGLELAGPSRPDSAIAPLLKDRGEGLLTIVFRVDSVDGLIEMANQNGMEVTVDLDLGDSIAGYRSYRQVSLASDRFPAQASFTFAEYVEG